jgi:PKD repeat protein
MRRLLVVCVGAVALAAGACTTSSSGDTANNAPFAVIGTDVTTGNAPLTVHFSSAASSDDHGIASYQWNFGDGSAVDTSANPQHVYSPGRYTASLIVTDADGLTGIAMTTITALTVGDRPPVPHMTATPTSGKAPLTVSFGSAGTTDPDGTVAAYDWDFGDGSPHSSSTSPTHRYDTVGTFTARLTVTDDLYATASITTTITTLTNVAPLAHASGTPISGTAPLTVNFSSAGSTDPDGTVVFYVWNFGDGSAVDSQPNPTHTYAPGNFVATLTVTDNNGAHGTATVPITSTNVAPTASAAATPSSGVAPLAVTFSSSGSVDPDGTIVTYSWDFGDGSAVDSSPNPSHTYAAGTYTATLTVTDNNGAHGTATVSVTAT